MRLIAKTQLKPKNNFQLDALMRTLERTNDACNYIASFSVTSGTIGQAQLHDAIYYDVREQFGLSAQMTIRCISRVVEYHKNDPLAEHPFRPHDAITYDYRIMTWRPDQKIVTLWTVHGRQSIPLDCGDRQIELLWAQHGESELIYFGEQFYIFSICEVGQLKETDLQGVWE